MPLEILKSQIANAAWFSRCGQFTDEPGAVSLASVTGADNWGWLPTSREQPDPIHRDRLAVELDRAGKQESRRAAELEITKIVLTSMRSIPDKLPALVDGPHDFTLAAKAGAAFAARMAIRELMVGHPAMWCRVIQLYVAGYWPCGWSTEKAGLVVQ